VGKLNDDSVVIRPDWWVVAIDETKHWNIAEEDVPLIDCILGVYIYDANTYTHCCELAPSYWLCLSYETIVFKGMPGEGASDAEERVWEKKRDDLEEKYLRSVHDDSLHYRHVSDVEHMRAAHPETFRHYGDVDGDDEDRGEEHVREHEMCNPPF
jgi:hypothetical protein